MPKGSMSYHSPPNWKLNTVHVSRDPDVILQQTCRLSNTAGNWKVQRWSRVLLENLIVVQLVKTSSSFHRTQRFISVLRVACCWTLTWVNWIYCTSWHPISLRSTLMYVSTYSFAFLSSFPTKRFYSYLIHRCVLHVPMTTPSLIKSC